MATEKIFEDIYSFDYKIRNQNSIFELLSLAWVAILT